MAGFTFRLQALQKLREHHRDQCREALAQLLAQDQALIEQREELDSTRLATLEELRQRLADTRIEIAQITSRRQHIGQLQAQIHQVDWQRRELVEQIAASRARLVAADQQVKVLENLEDKKRAEFEKTEEDKSSREREEIWQAGHWQGR
ncbi:hypothetical protein GC163_06360 [bacterium]|nr:hypothetical protein [bacterium]